MPDPLSRLLWGSTYENVLDLAVPLDNRRFGRRARAGSEKQVFPSGAEESAIVGRDFTVIAEVGHIPRDQSDYPVVATPWSGPLGVRAFLDWCDDAGDFRLVPDLRYPLFTVDGCRLLSPMPLDGETHALEPTDGNFRQPLVIRHPTVDLGLAIERGLMFEYKPGASLTDPVAFSFARADATTCASFIAPSGSVQDLLQLAAANVLRERHYIGALRTTLLERAGTNGWTKASQLNDAAWTKTRCSITANAALAPDGAITGDKVVEDATASNTHDVSRQFTGATNNTKSTAYVVAAPAERTWLRVTSLAKSGAIAYSWVNLATGAKGTVAGAHTITVRARPNGWYRVDVTYDVLSGASVPQIDFSPATGDGVVTYTGNGTSGIYLWRAGVEVDQSAGSSEIETDASTVTRAADALTRTWPFRPQAMWSYRKFVELGTIHANGQGLSAIGESDTLGAYIAASSNARYYFNWCQTAQTADLGAGPSILDVVELLALVYADGRVELRQSINGGAEITTGLSAGAVVPPGAWTTPTYRLGGRGTLAGLYGLSGLVHAKDGAGTDVNTMALARAK